MTARCADERVARIVDWFESLSAADLARVGEFYVAEANFKDPFNEVRGVPAIRGVFEHMFAVLHEPRFVVRDIVVQGSQCLLTWDFLFRFRRFRSDALQTVHGATHLKLAADGRIALHRDYWDAAEELYGKLPAIGGVMRWLRRRAGA